VIPGSYTLRATRTVGTQSFTGSANVSVVSREIDVTAPNINLVLGGTASPTPTPVATGRPTPVPSPTVSPENETYKPGQTYMISIPYMDSSVATAVTTVDRAFNTTIRTGTTENFRLFRYDATRNVYVTLTGSSILRRGEGYFLRPLARGVSLRTPVSGPIAARFPTGVTEFTITLRRNTSVTRDPNNGFNLIGNPFDPARFGAINWLESRVIGPDGRVYASLTQAVAAGLVSPDLFTLPAQGGSTYEKTQTIAPFRGYFARTFVDNVRVIVRARPR